MAEITSSIPYTSALVSLETTQQLNTMAADIIYVSIPNFPNYAMIRRLRVTAVEDGISGNVDVRVLSDGAGYRAATTDHGRQQFVYLAYNDEAGNGLPLLTWELDETFAAPVYYQDDTFSNTFHLSLENVSLTGATAFTVEVWADQITNGAGYSGRLQSFREAYILYDNSATDFVDYTLAMRNPWHQTRSALQILDDIDFNDEYFYIGAMKRFSKVYCHIGTPIDNATDINLVAEYLDNTGTWQALTVANNTDVAMVSGGATINLPFSYSGSIYWTAPSDWGRLALPDVGAVAPPDGDHPRYWVRFAVDDTPATWPTFYSFRQHAATGA